MMKKILMALALCTAVSCTSKSDRAQQGAQNFLDAFLANDYNAAADCCTDGFQVDFNSVTESFKNLDEPIRAILSAECAGYKAEISSVERVAKSDTFIVNYSIVPVVLDSTKMKKGTINSTLVVVDGKVDKLR